ncbi:MAG: hypothetical protein D6724_10890 [Armatimonadetes bacterium]|nr:MAG: hypothetical protein D6724_10890 [Armatimonadota bacterium]
MSARTLLCVAATLGAVSVSAQSSLPMEDGRLAQRVSVSHPVVRVEDFLRDLSQRLGVPLKVEDGLKEDLVIVHVRDIPARDLLERFASHFDWSWRQERDGYLLYQSKEQKEREDEAYREQFMAPLRERQKELKRILAEDASRLDALRRELEELKRRLESPATPDEEKDSLGRQVTAAMARLEPGGRLAVSLLANMSFEDFQRLFELGTLVYAMTPTPAQRPMGSSQRLAEEALNAIQQTRELARRPVDVLVTFHAGYDWPEMDGAVDVVYVDQAGLSVTSAVYFHSSVQPSPTPPQPTTWLSGRTLQSEAVEELLRPRDGSPFRNLARMRSLAYLLPKNTMMPRQGFAELAIAIAEALGLNLLSDSAVFPVTSDYARSRDAGFLLDALYRGAWKLDGTWILSRSATWAMMRRNAVPVPRLRAIRDRLYEEGGASLEMSGSLVDELGVRKYRDLPLPFFGIPSSIPQLRAAHLWYSMNNQQRDALLAGEALSVGRLSPRQRQLIWQLAMAPFSYSEFGIPYEDYEVHASPTNCSEWWPVGLPPDAELLLMRRRNPVVARARFQSTGELADVPSFSSIAALAARRSSWNPAEDSERYRPAVEEEYLFVVRRGNVLIDQTNVAIIRWNPSAPWVRFDELPKDLLDAIERARREFGGGG